jgi:hypothetical protein
MSVKIPEVMLACSDDEKRAFAAAYWLGVCVGELMNLGMSEEEVCASVERAIEAARAMRKTGSA